MIPHATRMASIVVAMALACAASAEAQEPSSKNRIVTGGSAASTPPERSRITPDFREADFSHIAQVVGHATGRNIVIGSGVCALVSAAWETSLTAAEFYQAFVSIARTLGFTVVEQGSVTTITLDDSTRKDSPSSCRKYPV